METLSDLKVALDEEEVSLNTTLSEFYELRKTHWPDSTYEPPVQRGSPETIIFLLEQHENGTAETEKWILHFCASIELNDIWVIDISLDTKTKTGKGATSPRKNKRYDAWMKALISNLKCKVFMVPPIVLDTLTKPKEIKNLAGYKGIPHPSLTNCGGRKIFVSILADALSHLHPDIQWSQITNNLQWLTKTEWCGSVIKYVEERNENNKKWKLKELIKEVCPYALRPKSDTGLRTKAFDFAAWFEKLSEKDKQGFTITKKRGWQGTTIIYEKPDDKRDKEPYSDETQYTAPIPNIEEKAQNPAPIPIIEEKAQNPAPIPIIEEKAQNPAPIPFIEKVE